MTVPAHQQISILSAIQNTFKVAAQISGELHQDHVSQILDLLSKITGEIRGEKSAPPTPIAVPKEKPVPVAKPKRVRVKPTR